MGRRGLAAEVNLANHPDQSSLWPIRMRLPPGDSSDIFRAQSGWGRMVRRMFGKEQGPVVDEFVEWSPQSAFDLGTNLFREARRRAVDERFHEEFKIMRNVLGRASVVDLHIWMMKMYLMLPICTRTRTQRIVWGGRNGTKDMLV